jgi:predicted nucleic acid-binding protein
VVLLDTTVVVDHLRGKTPSISQKLKGIGILYLPLTALGELLFGAYNSAFQAKGLKQVEEFLRICAVLEQVSAPLTFTAKSKRIYREEVSRFPRMTFELRQWRWNTVYLWQRAILILLKLQD